MRLFGRGDLPREVNVLAVIAFVVALGFGIVAPAIPLFARAFGVGTTAVGLAVSAFAFFRFVSAFSGGSLVERFGERLVLTAGLLIVAVTTGAAGLASSFPGVPGPPRGRRGRQRDVHRRRSLAAAAGRAAVPPRAGGRAVAGRIHPRRHRRAGGGRPPGRALAATALLPLRRIPAGRGRRRGPAAPDGTRAARRARGGRPRPERRAGRRCAPPCDPAPTWRRWSPTSAWAGCCSASATRWSRCT